jgi:hypothetical protein
MFCMRAAFGMLGALLMALSVGACRKESSGRAPSVREDRSQAQSKRWTYDVTVAADLQRFDVRWCFDARVPERVQPGDARASSYLIEASAGGRPLRVENGMAYVDQVPDDGCIDYAVDVGRAVRESGQFSFSRQDEDSLVINPLIWLWRPELIPYEAQPTINFDMPDGVDVSVAWAPLDEKTRAYQLDRTAYKWLNQSAFGRLNAERFERAGAEVEIVVTGGDPDASAAGIRAWVEDAVDSVSTIYGQFPVPRVQVLVVPVGRGTTAVPFGMAGRGGGAGVYLFLSESATDEELPAGWTTVHEFLHLGMPFCEDRWLGEGFVTYHTEIARTRMGHWSEQEGWRKLHVALSRGQRAMDGGKGGSIVRPQHIETVYQGGAAIAFLADVGLRRETKGKLGLDDALQEVHECCRFEQDKVGTQRMFDHLDEWSGTTVFADVSAYLDDREFPPVDEAFAELGVSFVGDDEVVFDPKAAGAQWRKAIMGTRR